MSFVFFARVSAATALIRTEIKATLRLALPLIFTQLLDNTLGFVDTLIAGRLDTASIASLAVANGLFWAVICVVSGLFVGLEVEMPRAFGQQKQARMHQLLRQGLWLVLPATLSTFIIVVILAWGYTLAMPSQRMLDGMWSYLLYVLPSTPFIFILAVLQRYWQSQHYVFIFTLLMLCMNGLNLVLNLAFVQGWFGHSFGVNGIALSTTFCRLFAVLVMIGWSVSQWWSQGLRFRHCRLRHCRPNKVIIRRLLALGGPSAAYLLTDIVAFNGLTFFAAQLGILPLAAHQMIFMLTCIVIMIPGGLSSSVCIRLGHVLGRTHDMPNNKYADAQRKTACLMIIRVNIFMCTVCMVGVALLCLVKPAMIVRGLTTLPALSAFLMPLVQLCAVVLLFDGLQLMYVGILRAFGEVKQVFYRSLLAHYAVGMPVGLLACFYYDLGVLGLWLGVTAALLVLLLMNWRLFQQGRHL